MNQPPMTRSIYEGDFRSRQLSDEDLVLRYKQSLDNRYVGILYERYMDVIFGISLKYLKNRHDSEDMMTAVFEKLLVALREKEVDQFRNWLFILVRNQCISRLRSLQSEQKRQKRYEDYLSALRSTEKLFGRNRERLRALDRREEQLRQLLATLPARQRRSLQYFYFEQRTYKEIAAMLGEKVGKVRSYIQNGRRNLRLKLSKEADKGK